MVKTILERKLREEIIERVLQLKSNAKPLWGTMNAFQMVKHCQLFEAWIHGIGNWDYSISRSKPDQATRALFEVTKDNTPLMQFAPSSEILIVTEPDGDFESERNIWLEHLDRYQNYNNPAFIHDFFGKMSPEQIGILAFKHSDHHLRQFGV